MLTVFQLKCPNKGSITGMGIKPGVTLIAGGGFHGKTTLLSALKVLIVITPLLTATYIFYNRRGNVITKLIALF